MIASTALLALIPLVAAAGTTPPKPQKFVPPAPCATCTSTIYAGKNNGSLPVSPVVPGRVYDRFITIWLENTDFPSSAASATFQKIAAQGILLTNYNGVTHPSEPNYVASITGSHFGMADDKDYFLPHNVSTLIDLLETKNISWATYQENMPTDAFAGDFPEPNYIDPSAGTYQYYKRKHNPHVIANSIAAVPERAQRIRNFNDFAVDVNASALPQHVFVTPNMVNDAHDTDVQFSADWLEFWLIPLLQNPNFNSNRTLIQLTYDENESYGIQNTVYTVLLGGAVPAELHGTNDTRFYTHYSLLSSVENNWDLPTLGRQDTNATVASVWEYQAKLTNHTNYDPKPEEIPLLNLTGIYDGPANADQWTPVLAPNASAVGAGNGKVLYNESNTDLKLTSAKAINLTAAKVANPLWLNPNYTYAWSGPAAGANGSSNGTATKGAAAAGSSSNSSNPSAGAGTAAKKPSAASLTAVVNGGVVALVAGAVAMLV